MDPLSLIGGLSPLIGQILDRFVPDPAQREAARLELLKAQQSGEVQRIEQQLSAILAEARSADPWTSRARPTFLYVIYFVILLCVVGGIVGIWWPQETFQAADNIRALLGAIPEALWALFGAGYLGYTGARTLDKWRSAPPPDPDMTGRTLAGIAWNGPVPSRRP